MPRSRSRSRSPYDKRNQTSRRRSRSPRQQYSNNNGQRERPRGSFKWKEKPRKTDEYSDMRTRHLERGYRRRSVSPKQRRRASTRVEDKLGVAEKFGNAKKNSDEKVEENAIDRPSSTVPGGSSWNSRYSTVPEDDAVQMASSNQVKIRNTEEVGKIYAATAGEPMIIVHVNDRLGTKAAIPCLASDPIRLFKAQVAARIGREPHEIMLKRQGERPFKDQLTLEDYGISNGVQLDLEVDTGD